LTERSKKIFACGDRLKKKKLVHDVREEIQNDKECQYQWYGLRACDGGLVGATRAQDYGRTVVFLLMREPFNVGCTATCLAVPFTRAADLRSPAPIAMAD
jgi:hypothetical protein